MDKTTDLINTSAIKKRLAPQRSKPIKSYKSILSHGENQKFKRNLFKSLK